MFISPDTDITTSLVIVLRASVYSTFSTSLSDVNYFYKSTVLLSNLINFILLPNPVTVTSL